MIITIDTDSNKIINGGREDPLLKPWDESPLFLFFSYFCYIYI